MVYVNRLFLNGAGQPGSEQRLQMVSEDWDKEQ